MSDQRGAADAILLHVLNDLHVLEEVSPIHIEQAVKFNPEMVPKFRHWLPYDNGLFESSNESG
jgi:hypothetical protein